MRFNPVECGKRMKALRESKNLTQMRLAEQLNISLNHVKALEHARRLFSIDLVNRRIWLQCKERIEDNESHAFPCVHSSL